ncbi:MAG: DUF1802 family protein, partial [Rubrobacter sp.]|nr:DUF1802 family protein [Rubrobacter sp.]
KKPLTVLILRAYVLPEPVELEYRTAYGGCKSWIELEQSVATAGSQPVLDDAAFEELTAPALGMLEGLRRATVGR